MIHDDEEEELANEDEYDSLINHQEDAVEEVGKINEREVSNLHNYTLVVYATQVVDHNNIVNSGVMIY